MTSVIVATQQALWDCRWSRPASEVTGAAAPEPPAAAASSRWVCVRDGAPRPIDERRCESCPHWQADDRRG